MPFYDYAYYKEGDDYIAILQKGTIATYNLSTATGVNDVFLTPTVDDSDAIMLEYVYEISEPTTETDSIDLTNMKALALVDYVKFRLAQEQGDVKMALYWHQEFRKRLCLNSRNFKAVPSICIPRGVTALR
jgi:hypothetical protein